MPKKARTIKQSRVSQIGRMQALYEGGARDSRGELPGAPF